MDPERSTWLDVIDWMKQHNPSAEFPPELPDPKAPEFWLTVLQIERDYRASVTSQLQRLIAGELIELTPLESWLFLRRLEFAGALIKLRVKEYPYPGQNCAELLTLMLITQWELYGADFLRKHAHIQTPGG